jgi:hypothetical protein
VRLLLVVIRRSHMKSSSSSNVVDIAITRRGHVHISPLTSLMSHCWLLYYFCPPSLYLNSLRRPAHPLSFLYTTQMFWPMDQIASTAGGWIGQKGSKYVTQAASISCIVHNAIFSDLSSGTPTASHQRTFSGSSKIGVLWISLQKRSADLQDALKKSIGEIALY